MKIIIFAGGSGRRLWPISRQKSPKQFEPIIGEKSTLQLAVDRVKETYGSENIFISTNERYQAILRGQLPELPEGNVIGEPARRDLAAAVGLCMTHLANSVGEGADNEPIAILWGDNTMENVPNFLGMMATAEEIVKADAAKIVFMGETPRFANEHLGWLGLGEKVGTISDMPYYRFQSLSYRPTLEVAQEMFAAQSHVWNTGYFVTTLGYVRTLYKSYQAKMWQDLAKIEASIGSDNYLPTLHEVYPSLESISFDDAILVHVPPEEAVILHSEMGWSDPGTLYALKEAVNSDLEANVTKGLVIDTDSKDCLIYNYEAGKLVVAPGLEGMIVVNTEDAVLIIHKDNIPLVKEIVNGLVGSDLEHFS